MLDELSVNQSPGPGVGPVAGPGGAGHHGHQGHEATTL